MSMYINLAPYMHCAQYNIHCTMYNINLAPYTHSRSANSHPPPPKRESHQKLGTSQPSAKEWINLHKQQLFQSLIQTSGQDNVKTDSFAKRNPISAGKPQLCPFCPSEDRSDWRRQISSESSSRPSFTQNCQTPAFYPPAHSLSILRRRISSDTSDT